MRPAILLTALVALGLAGCTVNNPAPSPGIVAVPSPAPTVITTQPAAPGTVILR